MRTTMDPTTARHERAGCDENVLEEGVELRASKWLEADGVREEDLLLERDPVPEGEVVPEVLDDGGVRVGPEQRDEAENRSDRECIEGRESRNERIET